jgi:hypothetical protein
VVDPGLVVDFIVVLEVPVSSVRPVVGRPRSFVLRKPASSPCHDAAMNVAPSRVKKP